MGRAGVTGAGVTGAVTGSIGGRTSESGTVRGKAGTASAAKTSGGPAAGTASTGTTRDTAGTTNTGTTGGAAGTAGTGTLGTRGMASYTDPAPLSARHIPTKGCAAGASSEAAEDHSGAVEADTGKF